MLSEPSEQRIVFFDLETGGRDPRREELARDGQVDGAAGFHDALVDARATAALACSLGAEIWNWA